MNRAATILSLCAALALGAFGCLLAVATPAKLEGLALMGAGLACLMIARVSQASDDQRALMERLTVISAQLAPAAVKPANSITVPPVSVVRTLDPPPPDPSFVRTADMPAHLRPR